MILTGTNAANTDTYVYEAFGTVITNTGSTLNNYRYTGEQFDPNLGFYYLRARYSNPNSGRFVSRDSYAGNIYDPASLHRYTYTGSDPVNHADPSGKDGLGTVLVVTAIFIVVVAFTFVAYKLYTSTFSRALRLESTGVLATSAQFATVVAGLDQINVSPRIQQFRSLLEDTGNTDLSILILPGDLNQGSHNRSLKHQLFIPARALAANDGGVAAAIFAFGEFQHDALGGNLSEEAAQKEIDEIIAAIRKAKPWLNVPDYRHGRH